MKIYRALSTLIPLVMMTSQAVAAEEVCLNGSTVIGIKDMAVDTEQYGRVNIDVDFRYATGYEVYGSELENFPFTEEESFAQNDVAAVVSEINSILNSKNPPPDSAGQWGEDDFFIGIRKAEGPPGEIEVSGGLAIWAGGAYSWEPCRANQQCNDGGGYIDDLSADERFTWADLSKADGLSCSGGPSEFAIAPGITGSWFDLAREGEGFDIAIIGSTLAPQLLAYFYTYDDTGNQMWLTGVADVDGDTAVVPMTVTSGAVFGPGFDPDDVIREDWGTITFMFSSCNAGSVEYVSNDFGSGVFDIIRLTSISGLRCP